MTTIRPAVSRHIPEPWRYENVPGARFNRSGYIRAADGIDVGYAYSDKRRMHVGEADANGRLMAAAPRLLTALRSFVEFDGTYAGGEKQDPEDFAFNLACLKEAGRTAIAEAEGGAA